MNKKWNEKTALEQVSVEKAKMLIGIAEDFKAEVLK